MENRRQHYRHVIDSEPRMSVLFQTTEGTDAYAAEIVNLSIGGMCAVADRIEEIAADGPWLAVFSLESRQMRMLVKRIYAAGDRPGRCGFQFVPAEDMGRREAQEQAIWKFLLERQRQQRKQAKEVGRLTA
jgi:c-di-GMP-binding flagellar brake protein YcgR